MIPVGFSQIASFSVEVVQMSVNKLLVSVLLHSRYSAEVGHDPPVINGCPSRQSYVPLMAESLQPSHVYLGLQYGITLR